ncbi:hypothetical protein FUA23_05025 [Neolewinella aurantiaca]|uniref:Uncharacterized protein n=1 Tax=Neolewinella aurantiaca TaxID=2602767 RepID=A0A5C7FHV4_9BACT|nr:hypothetical protein [Neolewinella aurantiaca]TXF90804.1 hypothetical protein FUA23_05025 [Neolewinella aurantiaca]
MNTSLSPAYEKDFWSIVEAAWASAPDLRSLANEKLITKSGGPAEMRKSAEDAVDLSFKELNILHEGMTDEDVAKVKAETVESILKRFGVSFGAELTPMGQKLSAYVNTTLFRRISADIFSGSQEEARNFILMNNELKNRMLEQSGNEIIGDSNHYNCAFAIALGKSYYERILNGTFELPGILMSEAFAYQLLHKYEEVYGGNDEQIAACMF